MGIIIKAVVILILLTMCIVIQSYSCPSKRKSLEVLVYQRKPDNFDSTMEVAACCCEYEGQYLFLKKASGRLWESSWSLPAGKVESNETSLQAVVREIFEETGVELDSDPLENIGSLYIRYPHLDFVFHIFRSVFSTCPQITLSDEHQEFQWIALNDALQLSLIPGGKEAIIYFKEAIEK